jgi:glycerophosphoryl diester phosphodiesterase
MERLDITPLIDVSAPRKRPRIIAHRGASREAPENTLPAIQRALDLCAEGIEFDVLLTSDRVPVVTHNDDLSILTHFNGYVHATPFDTVRALDVGSHFSPATAGLTMPTLAEALELIGRHDVLTVIDIKAQPGMLRSAAMLVGGMVSDIRMRGAVLLASSSWGILHRLRAFHPSLPRAATISMPPFPFFPTALFAKHEGISALHPSLRALSARSVSKMRRLGCQINAWTVNERDEFEFCTRLGVDGIFTDDVAFAASELMGAG